MKLFKTFIRWLLLALIAVSVVAGIYYFTLPQPSDVDVAAVTKGPMVVTVNEDGQTRIKERYVVSAPLSGKLLRVELEPGDFVVQSSTRLAAIAPRNPELLDARERQQAEMRVKARETALIQAKPAVERAQAALDYATADLERIKKLLPNRSVTRDQLDRAVMAQRIREKDYRTAVYGAHIAKYELELARAALIRTKTSDEQDMSDFELFSPIHGRVLRVLQESATIVDPGTPLIEVGDLTELEVVVDVLSTDAVRIASGAAVLFERWGGARPLKGKVRLVEPSAFTKVSALGVEEQRVNVIIDLVDSVEDRGSLGDGYRVEALIVVWEADDVIKIPSGALFREGERWATFVVEGDQASLRFVTIGKQNDTEAQVLDGLDVGESVILHPSDKIEAGGRVSIR